MKAEFLLHIDIRQLPIAEIIASASPFIYRCNSDSGKEGCVAIKISNPFCMSLQYRFAAAGKISDITQHITIAYTSCHYGGKRNWFICSHCGCRAARLYLYQGRFYCRKSLNLSYASQSRDMLNRMHYRIAKLENRLYEDGDKPCGMHWRIYDGIIDKITAAESRLMLLVI